MASPSLTTYLSSGLLGHALRGVTFTAPATVWVALFPGDPGESGTSSTEFTGAGYARQPVWFTNPTTNSCANTAEIIFPQATSAYSNPITHIGLMTAESAGSMMWAGALSASKSIGNTDQFRIAAGSLVCTLD